MVFNEGMGHRNENDSRGHTKIMMQVIKVTELISNELKMIWGVYCFFMFSNGFNELKVIHGNPVFHVYQVPKKSPILRGGHQPPKILQLDGKFFKKSKRKHLS